MIKTTLNGLGTTLNMLGVYIVYKNSPLNVSVIDGGMVGEESDIREYLIKTYGNDKDYNNMINFPKLQPQRNKFMRYGVYIILVGNILQLTSNFIED